MAALPNVLVYDLVVCSCSSNFTLTGGKCKLSGEGAISLRSAQCQCVPSPSAVNRGAVGEILDRTWTAASVDLVVWTPFAADKEMGTFWSVIFGILKWVPRTGQRDCASWVPVSLPRL